MKNLALSFSILFSACLCDYADGIRCYSDHSGPNSAGGIEICDSGAVCSSARIVFREDGILRKAMTRQCVNRTPDRSGSGFPWCHEEWAGGDEGGMEMFTCYCNSDLCNNNDFMKGKFGEWVAATMARLKAGPAHIMDIVVSIATGGMALFFVAVVVANVPWKKLIGKEAAGQEESREEDPGDSEEEMENTPETDKKQK